MLLSRGQWSRRVLVSSGDGASEHWARKRVSCFRAFKGVGTLSPERAAHSDKTLPDSQVAASGQPGPHSPFLSGALPGGVAPGGPRVFGTARQGRGPPLTPVRPQSGILKAEIAESTCTEQGQRGAGGQPATVPAPRGAGSRQKLRAAPVRLLLVVSRGLRKRERTTGSRSRRCSSALGSSLLVFGARPAARLPFADGGRLCSCSSSRCFSQTRELAARVAPEVWRQVVHVPTGRGSGAEGPWP